MLSLYLWSQPATCGWLFMFAKQLGLGIMCNATVSTIMLMRFSAQEQFILTSSMRQGCSTIRPHHNRVVLSTLQADGPASWHYCTGPVQGRLISLAGQRHILPMVIPARSYQLFTECVPAKAKVTNPCHRQLVISQPSQLVISQSSHRHVHKLWLAGGLAVHRHR